MAEPFTQKRTASRGLLARVRSRGRRSFVREVENLLAQADRVTEVRREQIAKVAERHGVDLRRAVLTPRRRLYRRFLEHCLADQALSAEESSDLTHLRKLLELGDEDARSIHDEVAHVFYGKALEQVLEDARLDPEEEQFLGRLRSELGISDGLAARLEQEGSERARQRFLDRAMSQRSALVADRDASLELCGRSERSLEDAVRTAIAEAAHAAPDLHAAELTELRIELRDGGVDAWCVKLRASLAEPKRG